MPEEEEDAASTITGASMIGSATEPANAVDAAAVKAAASTSFFILTSRLGARSNCTGAHPRLTSCPL